MMHVMYLRALPKTQLEQPFHIMNLNLHRNQIFFLFSTLPRAAVGSVADLERAHWQATCARLRKFHTRPLVQQLKKLKVLQTRHLRQEQQQQTRQNLWWWSRVPQGVG